MEKINEKKYEYGCIMLDLNKTIINFYKYLKNIIAQDDLYIDGDMYGIEYEPHVTILYGLHCQDKNEVKQIKNILKYLPKLNVKVTGISLFENEYDVLKFDIDPEGLKDLNELFKTFNYTSSYPKYEAHMTIAYLKKGCGKKYLNNDFLKLFLGEHTTEKYTLSMPNGTKSIFENNNEITYYSDEEIMETVKKAWESEANYTKHIFENIDNVSVNNKTYSTHEDILNNQKTNNLTYNLPQHIVEEYGVPKNYIITHTGFINNYESTPAMFNVFDSNDPLSVKYTFNKPVLLSYVLKNIKLENE